MYWRITKYICIVYNYLSQLNRNTYELYYVVYFIYLL